MLLIETDPKPLRGSVRARAMQNRRTRCHAAINALANDEHKS
jgi:hypothetical protein